MATLIVAAAPQRTGLDLAATAVAAAVGGDKFANTQGNALLYLKNGDASSHTLTIAIQATVDGQVPPAKTVVLAAGKAYVVGPFPAGTYNDGNGLVNLTYDAVTAVTVCAFLPA